MYLSFDMHVTELNRFMRHSFEIQGIYRHNYALLRLMITIETSLILELVAITRVAVESSSSLYNQSLLVLEFFAKKSSHYKLRKNWKKNLLLSTTICQETSTYFSVCKINHDSLTICLLYSLSMYSDFC